MLREITENYLDHLSKPAAGNKNLRERAFEVPFRALLYAMGYECQDTHTDHGMLEFGKDIIALRRGEDPPTKVYCFQMKVGDISKNDWNDMERQLKELLIIPVEHPNAPPDLPREPIWVTTGQLTPTVEKLMSDFNEHYRSRGEPEVHVWTRNRLIDLFVKHFFDISLFPSEQVLTVCQIILSMKDNQYSKAALIDFLERFLFSDPSDTLDIAHNKLSSFIAISAYLANRGREIDDLYNAYEQIQTIIAYMWRYLFRRRDQFEELHRHYELIRELLLGLAEEIVTLITEKISSENGLYNPEGDLLTEIIQYPMRIFDIIEKLSLLAFFYHKIGNEPKAQKYLDLLCKVIENNVASSHVIWERNMCAIWAAFTVLRIYNKERLARQWITDLIKWVSERFERFDGIPRPKASVQEFVEHHLAMPFDFIETSEITTSRLAPRLFEILAWFGFRDAYEWGVSRFRGVRMYEFHPEDEEQIYLEHMKRGTRAQVQLPKSWDEYQKTRLGKTKPPIYFPSEVNDEEVLLLISFCFADRVFLNMNASRS